MFSQMGPGGIYRKKTNDMSIGLFNTKDSVFASFKLRNYFFANVVHFAKSFDV